jgi:hypothetical protein
LSLKIYGPKLNARHAYIPLLPAVKTGQPHGDAKVAHLIENSRRRTRRLGDLETRRVVYMELM